jgi:hypothetical protein
MAKPKKWRYVEDKGMQAYGDINYAKKTIRVNPSKGDVVDTILHEREHKKDPKATEKQIRRRVRKKIARMSLREHREVIDRFLKKAQKHRHDA